MSDYASQATLGDVKPGMTNPLSAKPDDSFTIRLVLQAGEATTLRVKPTTRIIKALRTWATSSGQVISDYKYLYDGERILLWDEQTGEESTKTMQDLDIDADASIDILRAQEGGSA